MSDIGSSEGFDPTDDGFSTTPTSPLTVTQTVNQAQAQANTQQQQQQQGATPVLVTPFVPGQTQIMGTPSVLIPLDVHTQAQTLLAQLQSMLGL